jgi:beta-phosphoglucomutase
MSSARYEAILFDFDGVILDSEPVHFECWREVLRRYGIELDWETYREHCVGVADYQMLEFLGRRAEPSVAADVLWAGYEDKNRLFAERMRQAPPVPDANRRLIEELSGYRLAIVSSSGRAEVVPILEASGLSRHFAAIVCGDDVRRHKPDPEPYRLAAERLGVTRALVVEDSRPGAESGRAAGFDVLEVDTAERTAELVWERLGRDGKAQAP